MDSYLSTQIGCNLVDILFQPQRALKPSTMSSRPSIIHIPGHVKHHAVSYLRKSKCASLTFGPGLFGGGGGGEVDGGWRLSTPNLMAFQLESALKTSVMTLGPSD